MIEVLAPAGNIDALKSAVNNCTDAVYLGLEQFNARLKADNFSTHNIKEWVDFCHLYDVKVYVTINTCLKQKELDSLDNLLISCENAKVDAIIITDLAIVPKAKKLCPNVDLHASTQLGVHNKYGAKFLENLGFSRVVLARECTLADIKDIKANTNIEIEYFVHGALCVSFSGGCLLSGISNGNSGNRGLCLQLCRKEYIESLTGKTGYLISPKDQCLINDIGQLVEAGVDSLKIEGRLKSAEYVGVTVQKYRKAVDNLVLQSKYNSINKNLDIDCDVNICNDNKHITDLDVSEMKRMFNRGGFSRGYAFSSKNQMLYIKSQNHMGEYIGKIIGCTKAKDYYKIDIQTKFDLINGDGVKIFEKEKEQGGFEISIIEQKDDVYKVYSKKAYQVGANVNITLDKNLTIKINEAERKICLDVNVVLNSKNICFSSKYKNNVINFNFKCDLPFAIKQATTDDEIKLQLSKTGGTEFEFCKICVELKENLFIPKSILNQARREYVEFLKGEIIKINTKKTNANRVIQTDIYDDFYQNNCNNFKSEFKNIIICKQLDVNKITQKSNCNFVVNFNDFDEFVIKNGLIKSNLCIKLPKIAMFSELNLVLDKLKGLPRTVGIYADNIYAVQIAIEQKRKIIGGLGLNIFNNEHAKMLGIKNFVASSELSREDIESLGEKCCIYSLGYLPLMTFCHCPIQHFTNCKCADCKYDDYSLSDNFGKFEVRRNKLVNCYFELYNNALHFIPKEELAKDCNALIDFTMLNENENLIDDYLNNSCNIEDKGIKLTRGQFLRGVK